MLWNSLHRIGIICSLKVCQKLPVKLSWLGGFIRGSSLTTFTQLLFYPVFHSSLENFNSFFPQKIIYFIQMFKRTGIVINGMVLFIIESLLNLKLCPLPCSCFIFCLIQPTTSLSSLMIFSKKKLLVLLIMPFAVVSVSINFNFGFNSLHLVSFGFAVFLAS